MNTTTAALALKNLLDYEATTAYTLYMRITDSTKGWTGNITIRVKVIFDKVYNKLETKVSASFSVYKSLLNKRRAELYSLLNEHSERSSACLYCRSHRSTYCSMQRVCMQHLLISRCIAICHWVFLIFTGKLSC